MQSALKEDPFTGTVFVFRAKRADRLKILFWDDEADQETVRGTVSPTNGLVMAYKRLEERAFAWPAIQNGVLTLNATAPVLDPGRGCTSCRRRVFDTTTGYLWALARDDRRWGLK